MRVAVKTYLGGRKVYRKKMNENSVINIYCFLCGFILAWIIAIVI